MNYYLDLNDTSPFLSKASRVHISDDDVYRIIKT